MTNKKAITDIDVSSTFSTLNEKSEIVNEIFDHITNADLCIRSVNKIVVGHLNINSIRNKFDFPTHQVKGDIDILRISETKVDESFLLANFCWMATVSLSVLIGMGMVVDFIVH